MDDRERRTERAPSRSGGTGQSRRRKKKRRRRKNRAGRILVIILIALAVIAAVLGISYAVGRYFAGNYLLDSNQAEVVVDKNSDTTVAVEIPKGASTRDIAKILKDNGIIKQTTSRPTITKAAGVEYSAKEFLHRANIGQLTIVRMAAMIIAVKNGLTM